MADSTSKEHSLTIPFLDVLQIVHPDDPAASGPVTIGSRVRPPNIYTDEQLAT